MKANAYQGILLASASPRRRELLAQLAPHLALDVCPSDIDEERYFDLGFAERSTLLAQHKAEAVRQAVPQRCQHRLLLAADTEVAIDGKPFGKASDAGQAMAMLKQLAGRSHSVVTAYCVLDPADGRHVSGHCETRVRFKACSDSLLQRYVATGECFGKAGAYAIQGRGAALVAAIDGSYSNVVGLPLETIAAILQETFAWDIWQD